MTTDTTIKQVGDKCHILGSLAVVVDVQRADDVDYELYNATNPDDKRGFVRIASTDATTNPAIRRLIPPIVKGYPTFKQAKNVFQQVIQWI